MDFEKIFRISPEPSWLIRENTGQVMLGNDQALKLFGYQLQDTKELTCQTLFGTDLKSTLKNKMRSSNVTDRAWIRVEGRHKTGFTFQVEIQRVRFKESGEDFELIACRETENGSNQENKYAGNAIFDRQPVEHRNGIGLWRYDMAKDQLEWSDHMYSIWETHPSRLQPTLSAIQKKVHQNDISTYKMLFDTVRTKPGQYSINYRINTFQGNIKWVVEKISSIREDNFSGITVSGTVMDITDIKKEQEELRLLESVITNTNDAIIITEAEPQEEPGPKILYVNEAFTRMTGYTKEDAIGRSPRFLQGIQSDKKALNKLGESMKKWEPSEVSTINYKKNGEPFWINFKISPVSNERGYYTHWVAIERDITKQKSEEIESNFINRINSIFNSKVELQDIVNAICADIQLFGAFSFVELWLPEAFGNYLRLKGKSAKGKEGQMFYKTNLEFDKILIQSGLPGRIWRTGKSMTLNIDSANRSKFIRIKSAKQAHIRSVVGFPLTNQRGKTGVLLIGLAQDSPDIMNKVEAVKKLRHSIGSEIYRKRLEDEYNNLLQSVPDIVALLTTEGQIVKINHAATLILGYELHEIEKLNTTDIIHPEYHIAFNKELAKCINHDYAFKFTCKCLTKLKQPIWLAWNCKYNKDENIVFANVKDVTSERRLKSLLDETSSIARIGGWEIDLINNKVHWSNMVHELHETDPATFVPDPNALLEFYREDFRDLVYGKIAQTAQTGEPFEYEAVIITAKGNFRWIRAIGHTEKLKNEVTRIYGSFQDIEQFKQTENRLQSISDNLPGVIFQYAIYPDGTDKILSVSKGCERIWGFSREVCLNETDRIWSQIDKGGDKAILYNDIQRSKEQLTQWHSRYRYLSPDGKVRWLEGYGTPRKSQDGTVIWDSLILDITSEIRTKALYKETSKLARVGSWEIILEKGKELNRYWAPVLREILEVDEDYPLSITHSMQFFIPEDRIRYAHCISNLINNGSGFDETFQINTLKGDYKWVRCIASGDFVNGDCIRLYGSYQDITEKRNAELKLIEVLNSISEGFYALDKYFNFTYFNRAAEALLRKPAAEVMGKSIWTVFPETEGSTLHILYERTLKKGEKNSFEYYFPTDQSWYEVNVFPSSGGISIFFKNINQRKKKEDEIRKAYEEKNEILESIGDAFFAVDKHWTVTYWNRMAETLLKKSKHEILGRYFWSEYTDLVDTKSYEMYHRCMETGKSVSYDEYHKLVNKWFNITIYPSAKGLSIYYKDITDRKEWESTIRLANERFEKAAEATNDAIFDWHFDSQSIAWGRGFKALFGSSDRNAIDSFEKWLTRIHPQEIETIRSSIYELILSKETRQWKMDYRIQRMDGTWADVMHRGMIIRDDEGHPIRMVGAITDFTYIRDYERQLIELNEKLLRNIRELELANEELEKFAFITSHDLQEPLRMITSFMDLLKKKYGNDLDEKANQYIFYASDGAKRMKKIILDLLEYSRAGRQNSTVEHLSISDIVNEYMILRRKVIADKKAKILFPSDVSVICYPVPLIQVFHCLLDNSLKYSRNETNPLIEVTVIEKKMFWQVAVKDNGIGIDSMFFDKIFVIFQRLHNRSDYEGTGIGLSIVRKQVTSWGGKVWLESQPGTGSTFYFTIPKNLS